MNSLVDDYAAALAGTTQQPPGELVVAAPGEGPGYWAGGPSVVWRDGQFWLAYRLRRPVGSGRGYANVVARSKDGVRFETVSTVRCERFGAESLERPALVALPDGGWRLYVSTATPGTKHWQVLALDARDPADLANAPAHQVLPGDADTAWKDVVVVRTGGQWQMWACAHPLDGGDAEADRMSTYYLTSSDGLRWDIDGEALAPTCGTWDARGTRITSVLKVGPDWLALYDGRASAQENWGERTGIALGQKPGALTALKAPLRGADRTPLRYVSVVALAGGDRLYFEMARPDGAHDLRTAYVPRPVCASQEE